MMQIQSHKTAMARKTASKPARLLVEGTKFTYPVLSVLDWGCGKGQDVEYYKEHFASAEGYDPYYQADLPSHQFDVVTCSYVLNVIETKEKRLETLRKMVSFLKSNGVLLLTARSSKEISRHAEKGQWKTLNDGWVTFHLTFQKGLTVNELLSYLDIVLDYSGYKVLASQDNTDNTWVLVRKLCWKKT